jgi:NTP pyrophosphatase (non-canonical NTP hydrolase)
MIRICINELVHMCHSDAKNAGWWTDVDGNPLPAEVPTKIALIHSEISEALEADRKNLMDDKLPHRSGIEVELADAIIRICDLAGKLELDLGGAITEKMEYNKRRLDHKIENRKAVGGKKY